MSFKIRIKMFVAESRTCVSSDPVGRGLLYCCLSVLFLHIRFLFAGSATDRPSEYVQAVGPGLGGRSHLCLDGPAQGECQDLPAVGRTWGCESGRL